jgi:hypothetical protein
MELIYIALIAGSVLICIVFGLYACQKLSESYNNSSNTNVTYYAEDQSYRIVYPRARGSGVTSTATTENDSSDMSYLERERSVKEAEKEKEKRVAVGGDSDYYQDSSGRFV